MAEIISRPWEECDAAWLAIKTQVLCVFWAIGAKMIRAAADGTLDFAAACGRARQPAFVDEFAWFAEATGGPGRPTDASGLYGTCARDPAVGGAALPPAGGGRVT
jgi:hypothetical protein